MNTSFKKLGFIGQSPSMLKLYKSIKSVAKSDCPVLIIGETGTGKELVANALYKLSERNNKSYNMVNCGTFVDSLKESELFGYEKGTFTGACEMKKGIFENTDKGTLFLDEIGEMPLNHQPLLLRSIETGNITRIGSCKPIPVDVRIIAATNKQLRETLSLGKFREDLYYRLSMIEIKIPPLRERKEDISLLSEHFYNLFIEKHNIRNPPLLTMRIMHFLHNYPFFGNIRELKNILLQYILQHKHPMEHNCISKYPVSITKSNYFTPKSKIKTFDQHKIEIINRYLDKNNWNKQRTAKELGIAKSTLFKLIKRYKLQENSSLAAKHLTKSLNDSSITP